MQTDSQRSHEMALKLYIIYIVSATLAPAYAEMSLENITRLATGDLFSIVGTDCGPTRCMEESHGTALAALADGCACRCRRDTPAFREDRRVCVSRLDECVMASYGRGPGKPQIPFAFLPLKGQIIYPAKEIVFTDIEDAICAVTSAQYLSASGWVTLRDLVDNDVPFGLYRDEGSTFLQWRGSAGLHARLEGRVVAVHVLCSSSSNAHVAASCAAFRIAGATQNALLDVRSIPFHAGEVVATDNQAKGLSVLETLAIGVCVLMLIFIYAAGIAFYVHYKQKQKKKQKDPEDSMTSDSSENGSTLDTRIDMSNVMMKTNPLMKLGMDDDFMHDNGFSDGSERTEETHESSSSNNHNQNIYNYKFQKANSSMVSAMVHSRKIMNTTRPSLRERKFEKCHANDRFQRRSTSPDTFERAPQSDLSIVDCSVENHTSASRHISSSEGEPTIRRKLYFNPVFFETDHLKNPPPAAVEFLVKIREVMSIAKDKMTSRKFIPILSDIPEEELYHSVDLGWDFPCTRKGRRFSAISLKLENIRKNAQCGGCPGCDNQNKVKNMALTRSNSCKTCFSDDYKQRIVRKWLDEVPSPAVSTKSVKIIAKVSGTPRVKESKAREQKIQTSSSESVSQNSSVLPNSVNSNIIKPPKLTERMPKKSSKDQKSGENISKKLIVDSVPIENPKLLVETVTKTDNNNSNNRNDENDVENTNDSLRHEIKSPPKHVTRKIRKKLPPPPPPPPPAKLNFDNAEPIPPEVKVKMEAVIRELHDCRRAEPMELEDMQFETLTPIIAPKIIIPVIAADSNYLSNENMLPDYRNTEKSSYQDNDIEFDSLERNIIKKRRFSLACGPELYHRDEFSQGIFFGRQKYSSSWIDMHKAFEEENQEAYCNYTHFDDRSQPKEVSEIIIGSSDPIYDNVAKPGSLTIEVRGSPVESRRNNPVENFDPDTLDRKPKRDVKKRVEKILLKSAGSFKYKSTPSENEFPKKPSDFIFKNKIGNLQQIYEYRTHSQEADNYYYKRRGSLQYAGKDLAEFMKALKTPDLIRHLESQNDPKPPIPPKNHHNSGLSPKFSGSSPLGDRRRVIEDRDRFGAYMKSDNLNPRRSGRRSARTRSRRIDFRKLHRTEDSGYMSTDSNESKTRAKYLLQLRPKPVISDPNMMQVSRSVNKPVVPIESDTDELESLCDGRSESGGESVETDSVFFGHFDDSKELLAELGLHTFEPRKNFVQGHEQIDSGFVGETNIILSGDSDSEHRSVISIVTGQDACPPIASLNNEEEAPYKHTIEC